MKIFFEEYGETLIALLLGLGCIGVFLTYLNMVV